MLPLSAKAIFLSEKIAGMSWASAQLGCCVPQSPPTTSMQACGKITKPRKLLFYSSRKQMPLYCKTLE